MEMELGDGDGDDDYDADDAAVGGVGKAGEVYRGVG